MGIVEYRISTANYGENATTEPEVNVYEKFGFWRALYNLIKIIYNLRKSGQNYEYVKFQRVKLG